MSDIHRRQVLQLSVTGLAAGYCAVLPHHARIASASEKLAPSMGLGFSLYGMRSLSLIQAAGICGQIGYDCVELPVMAGWPADSAKFTSSKRTEFAKALSDAGLRMSALMENLPILGDESAHAKNLNRLKAAAEVGHAFTNQPIIETILGGKPQRWPQDRKAMAKRLEDWAALAEAEQVVIAIKAHVGGAMHLPQHPAELVRQVGSESIRSAYDFSHFRLRNVEMAASVNALASTMAFVHVKDAAGDASNVKFLLPGQGDIDYEQLMAALKKAGYRGDVVVEVSGQIHGKAGYDPRTAAKISYPPLAAAMKSQGIQRNRKD